MRKPAGMGKLHLIQRDMEWGKIIKGFSHCEEHSEADQKRQSPRTHCHSQLRSPSLFVFTTALFSEYFTILNLIPQRNTANTAFVFGHLEIKCVLLEPPTATSTKISCFILFSNNI